MAAGVLYPTMAQAGEWRDHAAMQPRGMFIGTPEIYFTKRIDNSRVVKVTDPKRRREMITFGITLGMLFLLVMVYLWQHFSAIEYGYRIEQLKGTRDSVVEANRALSLEESSLKDLARIDRKRKKKGSNEEWVSATDADARIAKMKDGTTHLAHKADFRATSNLR